MKTESSQSSQGRAQHSPRHLTAEAADAIGAAQVKRALFFAAVSGLVIAGISVPFLGVAAVPHVLFGVFISVANLWVITRTVASLMSGEFQLSVGALAFGKLFLLMVALYGLFQAGWIQGIPVFIGLGSLPIGIVLMQLAPVRLPDEENSSART